MDKDKQELRVKYKRRFYDFTLELIIFIDKLPKDNVANRLGDQLLRSGTSIIANYIEGQSASSKKDFTNFINHSLKSCNESKLWLSLLKDSNHSNNQNTDSLMQELIEISKILASTLLTLRNKR
jgi:four helix bundle protein